MYTSQAIAQAIALELTERLPDCELYAHPLTKDFAQIVTIYRDGKWRCCYVTCRKSSAVHLEFGSEFNEADYAEYDLVTATGLEAFLSKVVEVCA